MYMSGWCCLHALSEVIDQGLEACSTTIQVSSVKSGRGSRHCFRHCHVAVSVATADYDCE